MLFENKELVLTVQKNQILAFSQYKSCLTNSNYEKCHELSNKPGDVFRTLYSVFIFLSSGCLLSVFSQNRHYYLSLCFLNKIAVWQQTISRLH